MNAVWLAAAALLTIGSFWLLHTGTVGSGGRLRGWQLVAAFVRFVGTMVLLAYLIR